MWRTARTFKIALTVLGSLTGALRAHADTCSQVEITASQTRSGRTFTQRGTAVVVATQDRTLLLTPAHVVEGATRISARCLEGAKLTASLVRIDIEADLALLEPNSTEGLSPAFHSPPRQGEIVRANPVANPLASDAGFAAIAGPYDPGEGKLQDGHIRLPMLPAFNPLFYTFWSEHPNSYWIGHATLLQLQGTGVAPGMSGAPIYRFGAVGESNPQTGLAGIVIKTEKNGTRSIAIPAHAAEAWVREALSSRDTRVQSVPDVRVDYEFRKSGGTLARFRRAQILVQGQWRTFREPCPSGKWFGQTSGGGSWGDGGGGGSWGDGGGRSSPASFSGVPGFGFPMYSLHRDLGECRHEGLVDERGQSWIAARIGKRLLQVDQLEDLIQVARALPRNTSLDAALIPTSGLPSYSELCGKNAPFPAVATRATTLGQEKADESHQSFLSTMYHLKRPGRFSSAHFDCARNGIFRARFTEDLSPFTLIEVYGHNTSTSAKGGDTSILGDLTIDSQRIRGQLKIFGVDLTIDAPRTSTWSHRIELNEGTLLFEISTGERAVHLAFSPNPKLGLRLPWLVTKSWLRAVEAP